MTGLTRGPWCVVFCLNSLVFHQMAFAEIKPIWVPSVIEERVIAGISQGIEASIEAAFKKSGKAVRDAHAKQHGCVLAEFKIEDGLKERGLDAGLFADAGKLYEAVIRFSNGSGEADSDDRIPGGRGMAIKVMNVAGPKMLDDESFTQDFNMINFPAFFVKNIFDYVAFMKDRIGFFQPRPEEAKVVGALADPKINPPKNPLESQYFSMTPRQFGPTEKLAPIKFSAKPIACKPGEPLPAPVVLKDSPNALRIALIEGVKAGDSCFEFMVQRFVDEETTPVNNPVKVWDEAVTKFTRVATIRIQPQDFDNERRERICEDLGISPWHSQPELQPLGGIEATRRVVYAATSKLRRKLNNRDYKEPRGFQDF